MAIVNLKDVKVVGAFSKGVRVVEESTSKDGRTFTNRWTVWSTELGVQEGDVVSLSGFLSAKVGEWTDKEGQTRHSVDLSLNSPRLEGQGGGGRDETADAGPSVGAPAPTSQAGFGGVDAYSGEVPF